MLLVRHPHRCKQVGMSLCQEGVGHDSRNVSSTVFPRGMARRAVPYLPSENCSCSSCWISGLRNIGVGLGKVESKRRGQSEVGRLTGFCAILCAGTQSYLVSHIPRHSHERTALPCRLLRGSRLVCRITEPPLRTYCRASRIGGTADMSPS